MERATETGQRQQVATYGGRSGGEHVQAGGPARGGPVPRRAVLGGMAGSLLALTSIRAVHADSPMPPPRDPGSASGNVPPPPPSPRAMPSNGGAAPPSVAAPQPRRKVSEVGVYIPGAAQDTTLLDQFEALTGKRMAIVQWYQPWGYTNGWYAPPLDTTALNAVAARGATPMITWEAWGPINGVDPSHVANILTGAFDGYIDAWAQGLAAFGRPVYLRLFHEWNFQGYPWAYGVNGNTAQDLVAAWRYVHDRFSRSRAANVRWIWCPNPDNGLIPFSAVYPGDAYVDLFGTDVFNGGTQFDWGGWLPAQQIVDRTYGAFQSLNPTRPVIFAEASSVEQGGSKAQWITDLFTNAPGAYPNLRAIVWFDANVTTTDERNLPVADWRVDTSPQSLRAFRDV